MTAVHSFLHCTLGKLTQPVNYAQTWNYVKLHSLSTLFKQGKQEE